MPISSERHGGFILSKWENNYLKCRYKAHRNKVAAVKVAIDCQAPPERPHVQHKTKKALMEQRRQIRIMHENLRVLNRTAEIMNSEESSLKNYSSPCSNSRLQGPLTSITKRNARILYQWFIHKFGKYVPWWAQINY